MGKSLWLRQRVSWSAAGHPATSGRPAEAWAQRRHTSLGPGSALVLLSALSPLASAGRPEHTSPTPSQCLGGQSPRPGLACSVSPGPATQQGLRLLSSPREAYGTQILA